jgi:tetratricopeptide (TPR) repeat protein
MEKPKQAAEKSSNVPNAPVMAEISDKVPPLFRKVDWMTFGLTFLVVFIGYFLTLAPEMTLEDSGELAVASYYAGVPHPPGYPVWTLYTWLWTVLLPFSNVAWRVTVGCAFSGAVASGLLALVVSRGSSMIVESIDDLKNLDRKLESAICIVSGFVAGTLIGFNGYMWSQSVIVEVYPLSVVSLMCVVAFLMRWMYAPHQHRYLYWAFFLFGICVNNHQSLLVIAMGMQVLIWRAEPKLGREMFFWNTLIYGIGLLIGPSMLKTNTAVMVVYHLIGLSSAFLWVWLIIKTRKQAVEFARDALMLVALGCFALFFGGITHHVTSASGPAKLILIALAGLAAAMFFVYFARQSWSIAKEWWHVLACGFSWMAGMAFYLLMPVLGATNPPMQWGYPRTLEGFIHAFTRGQYDKINPTKGVGDTFIEQLISFCTTYGMQLWRFLEGLSNEFSFLYLLVALVVFLFYRKMKRRERVWIVGMVALFVCVGPFLVFLLNFSSDRQSLELTRVFLTSAHLFVAMSVGYGLTLLVASLAVHFTALRKVAILGGICALDFAFFLLAVNAQYDFDPGTAAFYGFAKVLCWMVSLICIIVLWRKGLERDRMLSIGIPGLFVAVSLVFSCITFFGDPIKVNNLAIVAGNIQGAFSPDQYGMPIFAALLLIVAGFVFLAAVVTATSKAPVAVTLVVLALMPSYSVMTHWFENEQREHWFGYWFGHDMFTPPFKDKNGRLSYDAEGRKEAMSGPNGHLVYPEMARDTILFGGTDPGRFAPTYMIFCDSFIPDSDKPAVDPVFDRRDVYIITQNALADGTYLQYIRAHYFRSDQLKYDTYFFQELLRGSAEREKDGMFSYQTNLLARLAARFLDKPVNDLGARIEAQRRERGVYPPNEIYTPTPEDSQRCFQIYIEDAQRRLMHDQQFPNEPRQIRQGEYVTIGTDNRVQVSGQVAVMAINGLLTKVIFDKNPTNEFYVEESFPLDWMFPHLTPSGVIMKINRQPLPELTDEIVQRDHQFWKDYSERLIGDWIDYDTPVKEIAAFAEKVYMRRNFGGFKGDRKFVRDDQAQKAFSKLRSSIGGIYSWRLGFSSGAPTPPQYIAKTEAERQRMIREAEFAFKQAFAFCPYSPEAVFRYVQLLANLGRIDDAILVAETCQKLDRYNTQVAFLLQQLKGSPGRAEAQTQIAQLEKEVRSNPADFQKAFELAMKYWTAQQPDKAMAVLDSIVNHPQADAGVVYQVSGIYHQLNNVQKLEITLQKLVKLAPNEPEAWYNLAAAKAALNKSTEALQDLKQALDLNARRLRQNTNATDLRTAAATDARFNSLRSLPDFRQLVEP